MNEQSKYIASDADCLQVSLNNLKNILTEKGYCKLNKKYINLLDLVIDLNSEQYLWLKNESNFKDILSHLCIFEGEVDVNTNYSTKKGIIKQLTIKLPNPETALDDLHFDNKFDKLILKIRNSSNSKGCDVIVGNTLSDVINLTRSVLSGLPNIGKKYIVLWEELKTLYQDNNNAFQLINPLAEDISEYKFDFDGMAINFSALTDIEKKNLEKLYRLKKTEDILEVVNFQALDFEKFEGTGRKFIDTIRGLKDRLLVELKKISSGEIDYTKMESELISSTKPMDISVEDIEIILLKDIDDFLDGIAENEQDIFQFRWGFVESELTLEEIGIKQGVTREYIRQTENKINNKLIKHFRLTQENIWLNLKDNINSKLPLKMQDLSGCFDEDKNFYRFLGYVCGDKNINNIVNPDIPNDVLNSYFAKHGEPCSVCEINEYIELVTSLDSLCATNVFLITTEPQPA